MADRHELLPAVTALTRLIEATMTAEAEVLEDVGDSDNESTATNEQLGDEGATAAKGAAAASDDDALDSQSQQQLEVAEPLSQTESLAESAESLSQSQQ
jgi:hypothetical protein